MISDSHFRTALGPAFQQLHRVYQLEGQRSLAIADSLEQTGHLGHFIAPQALGHQSWHAINAGENPGSQMVQHAVCR